MTDRWWLRPLVAAVLGALPFCSGRGSAAEHASLPDLSAAVEGSTA